MVAEASGRDGLVGEERVRAREVVPEPAERAERAVPQALDPLHGAGNSAVSRLLAGSRPEAEPGDLGPVIARLGMAGNGAVRRLVDSSARSADATPDRFERSVAAAGAGRSLPDGFRAEAEARFGADFSAVRVHDDAAAADATARAAAAAFTIGSDTYFAPGRYDPGSAGGRRLLAHELTHVVQQSFGPARPSGAGSTWFSDPADPAERAAEAAAEQFANGGPVQMPGGSGGTVARALADDVRLMSITPQYTANLPDGDLAEQLRTLDGHLATLVPGTPEYTAARENQDILQKEQVNRLVGGTGAPGSGDGVAARHARFQQAVLLSAQHRLTQNQASLDEWRVLIETQFSAAGLQTQVLAQSAADLRGTAERTGGMPAFNAWSNDPNPFRRNVEEHQARGEWRACTGCHEIVRADELSRHHAHVGPAWTSPADRLSGLAGQPPGPTDPWAAVDGSASARVQAAINAIRPVVAPLGDQGYRIIPDDVFSLGSAMTPDHLRATILARIAQRRADYGELSAMIAAGRINYLQLGPVLHDLLPSADAEVREAVADDERSEHIWAIVKIGATLILTLLALIFPPFGLALAAVQLASGAEAIEQGYAFHLGTGANDVFTRAQQDSAGGLMAGGFIDVTMALVAIAGALSATTGRSGPPAVTNKPTVEPDVIYSAPQVDPQTGVVSQMAYHRPTGQYLRATYNPATGTGEITNLSTGQQVAAVANGQVSPPARGLLGPGEATAGTGGSPAGPVTPTAPRQQGQLPAPKPAAPTPEPTAAGPAKPTRPSQQGRPPKRELTDDEKWEQAERALAKQEAARRGPGIAERYKTPEAAVGQVDGKVEVTGQVRTDNPELRAQGFTETWYVTDRNRTRWTVHHNPRTGDFTGAHRSSIQ
ncbi:eCIS core domain-containing protein [Phytohabitans sp. LJ34]|uniref:eCIS core domain-containing protein n=1 Tax=Phytohabitans sp. LJ34 TaxID=3452217 RepID=UPI003F890F64